MTSTRALLLAQATLPADQGSLHDLERGLREAWRRGGGEAAATWLGRFVPEALRRGVSPDELATAVRHALRAAGGASVEGVLKAAVTKAAGYTVPFVNLAMFLHDLDSGEAGGGRLAQTEWRIGVQMRLLDGMRNGESPQQLLASLRADGAEGAVLGIARNNAVSAAPRNRAVLLEGMPALGVLARSGSVPEARAALQVLAGAKDAALARAARQQLLPPLTTPAAGGSGSGEITVSNRRPTVVRPPTSGPERRLPESSNSLRTSDASSAASVRANAERAREQRAASRGANAAMLDEWRHESPARWQQRVSDIERLLSTTQAPTSADRRSSQYGGALLTPADLADLRRGLKLFLGQDAARELPNKSRALDAIRGGIGDATPQTVSQTREEAAASAWGVLTRAAGTYASAGDAAKMKLLLADLGIDLGRYAMSDGSSPPPPGAPPPGGDGGGNSGPPWWEANNVLLALVSGTLVSAGLKWFAPWLSAPARTAIEIAVPGGGQRKVGQRLAAGAGVRHLAGEGVDVLRKGAPHADDVARLRPGGIPLPGEVRIPRLSSPVISVRLANADPRAVEAMLRQGFERDVMAQLRKDAAVFKGTPQEFRRQARLNVDRYLDARLPNDAAVQPLRTELGLELKGDVARLAFSQVRGPVPTGASSSNADAGKPPTGGGGDVGLGAGGGAGGTRPPPPASAAPGGPPPDDNFVRSRLRKLLGPKAPKALVDRAEQAILARVKTEGVGVLAALNDFEAGHRRAPGLLDGLPPTPRWTGPNFTPGDVPANFLAGRHVPQTGPFAGVMNERLGDEAVRRLRRDGDVKPLDNGAVNFVLELVDKGHPEQRTRTIIRYGDMSSQELRATVAASRIGVGPRIDAAESAYFPNTYSGGKGYLVMERVEGSPLRESVTSIRGPTVNPLSDPQKIDVVNDLARKLGKLHAAGFVHRDLHVGNLIVEGKDKLSVRIIDFGEARTLSGTLGGQKGLVADLARLIQTAGKLRPAHMSADEWSSHVKAAYLDSLRAWPSALTDAKVRAAQEAFDDL